MLHKEKHTSCFKRCMIILCALILFFGIILKATQKKAYSVESLYILFEENYERFNAIKQGIGENDVLFCITLRNSEAHITSKKLNVDSKDIKNYSEILTVMEDLNITRVDYYCTNPAKIIFYFPSNSKGQTCYISCGKEIQEIKEDKSILKYIDMGNGWAVFGMLAI